MLKRVITLIFCFIVYLIFTGCSEPDSVSEIKNDKIKTNNETKQTSSHVLKSDSNVSDDWRTSIEKLILGRLLKKNPGKFRACFSEYPIPTENSGRIFVVMNITILQDGTCNASVGKILQSEKMDSSLLSENDKKCLESVFNSIKLPESNLRKIPIKGTYPLLFKTYTKKVGDNTSPLP